MIPNLACCLGLLLVIVLVVIVYYVRYSPRERYSLATPARPLQSRALKSLVGAMRAADEQAAQATDALACDDSNRMKADSDAGPKSPGAESPVCGIIRRANFARTVTSILGTPPTYSNYLLIYHGMTKTCMELDQIAAIILRSAKMAEPERNAIGRRSELPEPVRVWAAGLLGVSARLHELGAVLKVE